MSKRFALLYGDGSFGVLIPDKGLDDARRELGFNGSDPDIEIVEVEIKVIASHGQPNLKVIHGKCVTCPTCQEVIDLDEHD
jgi:hypothetical protein